MAVPVDGTGTASVETVKMPPVLDVQKPPRRIGKRFRDHLRATPKEKAKKPVGLKMRPTWLQQDRLGASPAVCRATRLGVCDLAGLEAADGNDLVQGPDSDSEGAGSATQNGIGSS